MLPKRHRSRLVVNRLDLSTTLHTLAVLSVKTMDLGKFAPSFGQVRSRIGSLTEKLVAGALSWKEKLT